MKIRHLLCTAIIALATLTASAEAPRYIFYFIGDGMGLGPVMATLNYKRLVHPDDKPLTMTGFPVASFCQTWSASTPVTDSAAAGTALSTGHKTRNGMLGMDADTVSVTSIARILKDDGWGIGVLTTVAPDDATPGAFYAHVPKRSQYYEIGIQAANSGYDFLGGASWRGAKDKEGNKTDIEDTFISKGYKTVYGRDGMATISGYDKVVVLGDPQFNSNDNDLSYTIDSVAGAISLPELTQAALTHLERVSPDRFFMMVEGGNIDHALHANDGGAAIKEIINFDEAITIAYNFYLAHPDETLIVITADHDTGGMALGNRTLKYAANLGLIDHQRVSKERFGDYCKSLIADGKIPTWDTMKAYLTEKFGFWTVVPVTDEQTVALEKDFDNMVNKIGTDEKTLYASFNQFAVSVFGLLNDVAGFGFTTSSHTGNPVPVFAVGVGADSFKSLNNNVEIPATMLRLATGKELK